MLYHKIATGFVKSEERQLDAADEAYANAIMDTVMLPATDRIYGGRKITLQDSRRMFAATMERIAGNPCVLSARHLKAGKSLSANAALDALHTTTMTWKGNGSVWQLVLERERIEMQPRAIMAIHSEAALEFTRHAYQRVLQRSEGRKEVVKYMMAATESHIGLLYLMLRAGSAMPQRSIAFPMGDGLLLGAVVNEIRGRPAGHVFGVGTDRNGPFEPRLSRPPILKEPGCGRFLGFQARTYIGPAEMKPQQKELHTRLLEIFTANSDALNRVADYCYFPDDLHDKPEEDRAQFMQTCDEIQEQVVDLLMFGRYARAMGNERSPATRPLPAFTERTQAVKQMLTERAVQRLMQRDQTPQFTP